MIYLDYVHSFFFIKCLKNSSEKAASVINDKYGKVDLLINASGILKSNHVNSVEFSMENINAENLMEVFSVNSLGTLLLLKSFKSLLKNSQTACIGSSDSDHRAVFLNVAAQIGTFNYNCNSLMRMGELPLAFALKL